MVIWPSNRVARRCATRFFSKNTSVIDFNNAKNSFQSKSNFELLRSYLVFSICQSKAIVNKSEDLLRFSYRFLGRSVTNQILKITFFGHFCAGESELLIKPTVDLLQSNGVGSILDYASESDVQSQNELHVQSQDESVRVSLNTVTVPSIATAISAGVQCRIYDYKDEVLCDMHMQTFENCIRAVHNVSPTGFAAIKCTALGNPKLLETISIAITELRQLFEKFDTSKTGLITKEQFRKRYDELFVNASSVDEIFQSLDVDHDETVDYIEWTNGFAVDELHKLTDFCREQGPLAKSILAPEEIILFQNMRKRLFKLASLAHSLNVRLMIDAEHTYFQPAIDYLTRDLAKTFNKQYPVIFSTYQMYLKDSRNRLFTDIKRSESSGYKFAAKMVRGAYMNLERSRAVSMGYDDPIHSDIAATHCNYNESISEILRMISEKRDIEVMIASHNQDSIEIAIKAMKTFNLEPNISPVYFGQLLGMSDHLSFSLGNAGYKAYKYVPYGKIEEVMPYLIRRAQENSDALGGARKELELIRTELFRRMVGPMS